MTTRSFVPLVATAPIGMGRCLSCVRPKMSVPLRKR